MRQRCGDYASRWKKSSNNLNLLRLWLTVTAHSACHDVIDVDAPEEGPSRLRRPKKTPRLSPVDLPTEDAPVSHTPALPRARCSRAIRPQPARRSKGKGKARAAPPPDSDDEDIVMEGDDAGRVLQKLGRERRAESNLQRWIKQLAILLKEEQRKVCVAIPPDLLASFAPGFS